MGLTAGDQAQGCMRGLLFASLPLAVESRLWRGRTRLIPLTWHRAGPGQEESPLRAVPVVRPVGQALPSREASHKLWQEVSSTYEVTET